MKLDEIITQLSTFTAGEFPTEAVLAAEKNWPQVLPHIHNAMEKFIADPNSISDEESYFIFIGIWLLAQKKESQSLPLLLKVCDRDDDFDSSLEYLLGDSLTENLPSFFYILADNQTSDLVEFINSDKAGYYVKCAAIRAIFAQFEKQTISESALKKLFKTWISNAEQLNCDNNEHILAELANLAIENQFNEFQETFISLAQQQKLALDFISLKEIETWQSYGNSQEIKSGFIKEAINVIDDLGSWPCYQDKPSPITDVEDYEFGSLLDEMINNEAFYDIEPATYIREQPKTGRNDPCLCGSGKKYKKCCM